MTENVFLTIGPIILCQGARGIPIGGFLSAQIAEIWACWKEFTGLFGDLVPTVQQKLTDLCAEFSQTQGIPVQCIVLEVTELVDHFPDDQILAHDMLVSKHVHTVTPEALCQSGFSGWWFPADRVFATAQVAGQARRFIQTLPWDGHHAHPQAGGHCRHLAGARLGLGMPRLCAGQEVPDDGGTTGAEGGRLQSIVRHSTGRNRRAVMQFFRNFDALNGVVGEILSADTVGACAGPSSQSTPVVIISRPSRHVAVSSGKSLLGPAKMQMTFCLNVLWSPSPTNATPKRQLCSPSQNGSLLSMTQTTRF